MSKIGFDNNEYIRLQTQSIRDRINTIGGKLYLEFGGKLFDDYHAARVLPGFMPDSKVKMLLQMKDDAEIVIAISANAIEQSKRRGDSGITYDQEVMRLIDAFRGIGLYVGSVVVTMFSGQPAAVQFEKKLKSLEIPVFRHYPIAEYPSNVTKIISEEGFGKNDYIETTRSLVVITAPGPGSGKMEICLSQLYHEHMRGLKSGYAKFETFPIWNLPLKHPVNLAYEAATADLNDVNMIDPYHLAAYNETTVNYNRDIEIFPVLRAMFTQIYGESPYQSPTDMGVNMVGYCITDDRVVCDASKQEILRRYYSALCAVRQGLAEQSEITKLELLMNTLDITTDLRPAVAAALNKSEETNGMPAVAIETPDGRVVTGKTSNLLGASSAALLNVLKVLGNISDLYDLISPTIIEPIQKLKVNNMGNHNPRLHTDEVLIALSICALTDSRAKLALEQLPKLRGCEAHSTVILSQVDSGVFHKLGVNITCEPKYQTKKLYHKK